MDRRDPTAHSHGGGLRRVPRHALQGEELRRLRGHAGPSDDALLQQRQRAHLGRGAQRAHGLQHAVRRAQVPREERLVLNISFIKRATGKFVIRPHEII